MTPSETPDTPVQDGVPSTGSQSDSSADSSGGDHGRRLMSLGDQVLSGASNFLTVALVARSTSPQGFGHFALAYAVLLALLSLTRGFWGTPVSLAGSPRESLAQARRFLSAALVSAPVMALPSWCRPWP